MSADADLREMMDEWPYDADNNERIVPLSDGREVLQVRLPLGIEQYELDGRPDGARPHGMESALEFHRGRLARTASQTDGEASFRLLPAECIELFEEGTLYYYRYLHLFRVQDWGRTVRDTTRNLGLFDFVHRFAEREEDRTHLEQWRPYLFRVHAVASAMIELKRERYRKASEIVKDAIATIESLPNMEEATFQYERQRSLLMLRQMITRIDRNRPLSELELLEEELRKAIKAEQYERAAELRDRIRVLRGYDGSPFDVGR